MIDQNRFLLFKNIVIGFIDDIERSTGKPVVTSMQAFMWDIVRTAGETKRVSGYGQLFAADLQPPEHDD